MKRSTRMEALCNSSSRNSPDRGSQTSLENVNAPPSVLKASIKGTLYASVSRPPQIPRSPKAGFGHLSDAVRELYASLGRPASLAHTR